MEINHVLIVEDDKEIRKAYKFICRVRDTRYFRQRTESKGWKFLREKRFIWQSLIL